MPPPRPNSRYLLLVEGPDDQHVTVHLLKRHGYDWDDPAKTRPFIEPTGGVEKLLTGVQVALKGEKYKRVGIILDANSNPQNRWRQLQDRARLADISLPETPAPAGTIGQGRHPGTRFGVWLMPDNSAAGNLESFLLPLIPEGDRTWSYAEEVALEARKRGAPCPEKYHEKSALHTWLAWRSEPGLPPGTAIKAEMLLHDTPAAQLFVAWFKRLFVEP